MELRVIYTHVAAALASLAIGFTSGWWVQGWRYDSIELQRQETARESGRLAARAADAVSERHEADKAALRAEFKPIYKEVEVVVQKPVYRNVCLDADGLRLLERAVRGPAATGQPAQPVRGSGATR